jgi:hypothetical protein
MIEIARTRNQPDRSARLTTDASSRHAGPPAPELPPVGGELADQILPLIGAVPVAGPPLIWLVGPWLLLTLMLAGPFLLLVTFALIAALLVALVCAVVATEHLLARLLGRLIAQARRVPRMTVAAPAGRPRIDRPAASRLPSKAT